MSDELLSNLRPVVDFFELPKTATGAKDFYVVRAIKAVASVDASPFTLVFDGGTALARAHRLVERMSEDVDFKIVPVSAAMVSRSKAAADAEEFRNQYPAYISDIASETTKALASLKSDSSYRSKYNDFTASMVYGKQVTFDDARETVTAAIQKWITS